MRRTCLWLLVVAMCLCGSAVLGMVEMVVGGAQAVQMMAGLSSHTKAEMTTIKSILSSTAVKQATYLMTKTSYNVYMDESGRAARERIVGYLKETLPLQDTMRSCVAVAGSMEIALCGSMGSLVQGFVEKLLLSPEATMAAGGAPDTVVYGALHESGLNMRVFEIVCAPLRNVPNMLNIQWKTLVIKDVQFQPFMYIEQYEKAYKNAVRSNYRLEQRVRTLGTFYTSDHFRLLNEMVSSAVHLIDGVSMPRGDYLSSSFVLHDVSSLTLPASTYTMDVSSTENLVSGVKSLMEGGGGGGAKDGGGGAKDGGGGAKAGGGQATPKSLP